jgi:hypothetical protein
MNDETVEKLPAETIVFDEDGKFVPVLEVLRLTTGEKPLLTISSVTR